MAYELARRFIERKRRFDLEEDAARNGEPISAERDYLSKPKPPPPEIPRQGEVGRSPIDKESNASSSSSVEGNGDER